MNTIVELQEKKTFAQDTSIDSQRSNEVIERIDNDSHAQRGEYIPRDARLASRNTEAAEAAVDRLNEEYGWVRELGEIYRFSHNDFIKPDKFHREHENDYVEAFVRRKLKDARVSDVWLRSARRGNYDRVIYAPGKPRID